MHQTLFDQKLRDKVHWCVIDELGVSVLVVLSRNLLPPFDDDFILYTSRWPNFGLNLFNLLLDSVIDLADDLLHFRCLLSVLVSFYYPLFWGPKRSPLFEQAHGHHAGIQTIIHSSTITTYFVFWYFVWSSFTNWASICWTWRHLRRRPVHIKIVFVSLLHLLLFFLFYADLWRGLCRSSFILSVVGLWRLQHALWVRRIWRTTSQLLLGSTPLGLYSCLYNLTTLSVLIKLNHQVWSCIICWLIGLYNVIELWWVLAREQTIL